MLICALNVLNEALLKIREDLQALEIITMAGALPRRAGNSNELLETSVIGHDQREHSRRSDSKSSCIMENIA